MESKELAVAKIAVASVFDLNCDQLFNELQYVDVVTARRFVFYVLKNKYNYSVTDIAIEFGKSESSIYYSLRHIDEWLIKSDQANKDFKDIINIIDDYENRNYREDR